MKVLFVIDHLGVGGAQRQLVNLACGFSEHGHDVHLFSYFPQYRNFAERVIEAGIHLHEAEKKEKLGISVILSLRKLLKAQNFDAAVSFLDTPNFYLELSSVFVDMPIVVSERSTFPQYAIPFRIKVQKQFHRLASHVTTNSSYHMARIVEAFPWLKGRTSTIYNGINNEFFLDPSILSTRSVDSLLVLANSAPVKNALGLAKGLLLYRERYRDSPSITWAGRLITTGKEGTYLNEVNEFLKHHELEKHWRWLGHRADVKELLREHDALVQPSLYEGLPNAICEAFACGMPVLASKVCEHPVLVQEGKRGFLFDPGDPADIALAIRKLVTCSVETRRDLSREARKYAEDKLSMKSYVEAYENLLKSVKGY